MNSFNKDRILIKNFCEKYGIYVSFADCRSESDFCLISMYDEESVNYPEGFFVDFMDDKNSYCYGNTLSALKLCAFLIEKQKQKTKKAEEELEYYKEIALNGKPETKKRRM